MTRLRELEHRGMHPKGYRTILIGNAADEIEFLRRELALALARTCRCVNTGVNNES